MTKETAIELQELMAKEGVALLMLTQNEDDTSHYEKAIRLIGEAWGIASEETERWVDKISQERQLSQEGKHVYSEDIIPVTASGAEILENMWRLFETAVELKDVQDRRSILKLAKEMAEYQSLNSWIGKPAKLISPFSIHT